MYGWAGQATYLVEESGKGFRDSKGSLVLLVVGGDAERFRDALDGDCGSARGVSEAVHGVREGERTNPRCSPCHPP